MELQKIVDNAYERWDAQATLAEKLLAQVQATEGANVTFPKDGIDAFFMAISVGVKENYELAETVMQDEEERYETLMSKAIEVLQDAMAKAGSINSTLVEYIESIGKTEEFQKFVVEKMQ